MCIKNPVEAAFFPPVQHRRGTSNPHDPALALWAPAYAQPLKGPRPFHPAHCVHTLAEWLTSFMSFPYWISFIGFKIDSLPRCHRWGKSSTGPEQLPIQAEGWWERGSGAPSRDALLENALHGGGNAGQAGRTCLAGQGLTVSPCNQTGKQPESPPQPSFHSDSGQSSDCTDATS